MIRFIRAAIILSTAIFTLHAEHLLTVDDLIGLALRNSPDLNVSRSDVNISQQQERIAVSDYLPQVDLSGNAGAAGVESEVSGVKVDESGELLTGTLSASQLVYDFGKTGGNIRRYARDTDAARSALQQAIADKILDVKSNYYKVLKSMSLIKVGEENVALNEKQLVRSKRYYEAGIRTKIDVTDARVNLIQARLTLQDSRYDLQLARISLERAIGTQPFEGNYTLYNTPLDDSDLFRTLPNVDQPLKALESRAYDQRQELKTYVSRIESAQSALTSARGNYYPGVFLQGSYTLNETDKDLELYFPKQQWGAGVGLKWNLFEGMRTDASVLQQRSEVLKRTAAYDDARLTVRQEVADTHTVTLKRRDGVKLSQSLAEAAEEKFVQAQKRYEYGLSDYIELQQARQGYIDARSRLYVAYYDFYIALAQRDRAVGN